MQNWVHSFVGSQVRYHRASTGQRSGISGKLMRPGTFVFYYDSSYFDLRENNWLCNVQGNDFISCYCRPGLCAEVRTIGATSQAQLKVL